MLITDWMKNRLYEFEFNKKTSLSYELLKKIHCLSKLPPVKYLSEEFEDISAEISFVQQLKKVRISKEMLIKRRVLLACFFKTMSYNKDLIKNKFYFQAGQFFSIISSKYCETVFF